MKAFKHGEKPRLNIKRGLIAVVLLTAIVAIFYWYSYSNVGTISKYLLSSAYQSSMQNRITFTNINISNNSAVYIGYMHDNASIITGTYSYRNDTVISCAYGSNYAQGQLCKSYQPAGNDLVISSANKTLLVSGYEYLTYVYTNSRLIGSCTAIGYDNRIFVHGVATSIYNATLVLPGTTNATICRYHIYLANGSFGGGAVSWPSQHPGSYTIIKWQNET